MSLKILVVEDDAFARDLLTMVLQSLNYLVQTAENGSEAIDKYVDTPDFDLIISDMYMPVMNGMELITELRKLKLDVPIIILTGSNDISMAIEAMKNGANDFLLKDENIRDTIDLSINSVLEKRNLEKKNLQLLADMAIMNSELESYNKRLLEMNEVLNKSRDELAMEKEEVKMQREAAELRSRFIQEVFGRYLSDDVVKNILETPAGLKLGGEKCTVTIMMADLRGFTSIGERLPAEDVVAMLNIYLEAMTEIIFKYNGTIDEFIGDAILVIFGAPICCKDDAVRAIACALEMQLGMQEVNRRNRVAGYPDISMGIGINTGNVVAGNIGSRKRVKYGVVGRNVNITSRIESYTVGGQVLVSEKTLEACKGILRIDDIMEVMPKGVKHPITIYEVGGIGGEYNIYLPERNRIELNDLRSPVSISFAVLEDKDAGTSVHQGKIVKMLDRVAEIHADISVDRLSNLRISLWNNIPSELYAKVTEVVSSSPSIFRVHITSILPEIDSLTAGFATAPQNSNVRIKFIGVGSHSAPKEQYHSNMLITAGSGKKMLVDCGSDVRFALAECHIQSDTIGKHIDAVYVSHLHSDHAGGLEWIAYNSYFGKDRHRPKLFIEEMLLNELWEHSLRGGLECVQGKCMRIDDYFSCVPVTANGSFQWEGLKFTLNKMPHITGGCKDLYSFGLKIESGQKTVFVTTDTQFQPELIAGISENSDVIFHDCETAAFKTGVHSHYDELCTLSPVIKQKMWLYHYQSGTDRDPEKDGFRGFVRKGQEFIL